MPAADMSNTALLPFGSHSQTKQTCQCTAGTTRRLTVPACARPVQTIRGRLPRHERPSRVCVVCSSGQEHASRGVEARTGLWLDAPGSGPCEVGSRRCWETCGCRGGTRSACDCRAPDHWSQHSRRQRKRQRLFLHNFGRFSMGIQF